MTHLAEQVERIETELAELRVRVAKMRAFGGWDEAVRGMP